MFKDLNESKELVNNPRGKQEAGGSSANVLFGLQVVENPSAALRIAVDGVPVMADIMRNFTRHEWHS